MLSDDEREAAYDLVDASWSKALCRLKCGSATSMKRNADAISGSRRWNPGSPSASKTTPLARIGPTSPGAGGIPLDGAHVRDPAVVAGVEEICCCTPPPISPITLVALDIVGINEIYRIGGAQAIAAMAIGTETVPAVEKIVGPGNIFVTAAKMLLRDTVEIDFPAGPSEIAVLADSTANPTFIAADILAQAEHDPSAACVLVTTDATLADSVGEEVRRMAKGAARRTIIEEALEHSGYIIVDDIDEAVEAANRIAPEHLSLQVADPLSILTQIQNAGSVFVGPYTAVACGDYASGTNHVLPTAGYARLYSGLDVNHFCRRSTVQMITKEGLEAIGDVVETIADAEGLCAHAESVRVRRRR